VAGRNLAYVAVADALQQYLDHHKVYDLKNVGAILGPGHEDLIAEENLAMQSYDIQFHYAVAETDRETLYFFNRLIREIADFVLFPDNRILSRAVLTEMMNDAVHHQVQVAVFNEPLLQLGATFNAGSVPANIAATMTGILDEMIKGNFDRIPAITALSDISIEINPAALQKLGLSDPSVRVDNTMADAQ
jgi:hypothetical protein